MPDDPLLTPVQYVSGVGPKRAELLGKLELRTVADVLYRLPRDVLDLTKVSRIPELTADRVHIVRGEVVDLDGRESRNGRSIYAVLLKCDSGHLRGVWFNQPWIMQKFKPRDVVLFSGKPAKYGGRWQISHPQVQWLDADDASAHGGMLPRYGLTEGLKMHEMRRIVRTVVEQFADQIPDALPEAYRSEQDLPHLSLALRQVHLPANPKQYATGKKRLIFDDLLEMQLGLALRRRAWKGGGQAPVLDATTKVDARIRRLLPFTLTVGQEQAIREVTADLRSGWAMHRLLQADVGAGKTVVAIYAMLTAVAAGYQAVMMAPTELLASQHWAVVEQLLRESRVSRVSLTGQLTAAERRTALSGLADGTIQLAVGTQALIQKDVSFAKLGLVVIDEQHKFGVMQRARFAGGRGQPHTLVMTATPIPRSLCLTQFGDLDLSLMTDMPPGRQSVHTARVDTPEKRGKAWEFVRKKLQDGRQAFLVCPRIESDLDKSEGSAIEMHKQLVSGELRYFRIGLLHGQLPVEEKSRVMDAFRAGELQAVVSTTVVEVGVDVPNATLMLVFHAESFGLSQLHQLRGRVGRGNFKGFCFLFSDAKEPEQHARLQALEQHPSGFDVAEADFQIRGPGDILGTRQHGDLPLRVADLARDKAELVQAREEAFRLVEEGRFDSPEFMPLKVWVMERFGQLFELTGSG